MYRLALAWRSRTCYLNGKVDCSSQRHQVGLSFVHDWRRQLFFLVQLRLIIRLISGGRIIVSRAFIFVIFVIAILQELLFDCLVFLFVSFVVGIVLENVQNVLAEES